MSLWEGKFGEEYTIRNLRTLEEQEQIYKKCYGVTAEEMNGRFLKDIDRDIKVLEVGCNVGTQLEVLQKMGFTKLYGIEISRYATDKAKQLSGIDIIQGNATDIPFKSHFFDLVFTSGTLILIPPEQLDTALNEIVRCTNHYIFGLEPWAPSLEIVNYRGHTDAFWKRDFVELYLSKGLKVIDRCKYKYLTKPTDIDEFFLLEMVK